MKLRRVAIGLAVTVGFVTPLAVMGSAASATPTSGSASTYRLAAAGQWIPFSGHVSGGARPVVVYWGTGSGMLNPVRGKSNAAGNFTVNYRMMTMPSVAYTVVAPAYGKWARWSKVLTVKGRAQDIALTRSGNQFTAQLEWEDLATTNLTNASAQRPVDLQQQVSPNSWKTVQTKTTAANGSTTFTVPSPTGTYRARVAQSAGGLSAYVSFPVVISPPSYPVVNVSDPAGASMSPMPNSGNGAAQRYNWWPNNLFWDMEQGEGIPAQGCTTHCAAWTDYSTGSGRVNVRDGQISLESSNAGKFGWGYMSSTMQIAGYKVGRWEMRVHQAEYKSGATPYTTQISLVPAGTSDATRNPSKQIILGQWRGYNPNTTIAVKNGASKHSRVIKAKWNRNDWNDLAVQINGNAVTFLLNGNVVGHTASSKAITSTNWVVRIEMIDQGGRMMDRARGGIDWVRYFTLNRSWAHPLPLGSAF